MVHLKEFGCNLKDLIEYNQKAIGSNPHIIFPDMVLVLPNSCQTTRLSAGTLQNKPDEKNIDTVFSTHHIKSADATFGGQSAKIAKQPNNELKNLSAKNSFESSSSSSSSSPSSSSTSSSSSLESGFDFSIFNVLNSNSDVDHSAYRSYEKSYERSESKSFSRSHDRSESRSRSRSSGRSTSASRSRSKSVSRSSGSDER